MKLNKTKFIIAALITCSTIGLAGSISSTIAWYQYSTRVSAVYLGASAGAKGNLKIRIKGTTDWHNDLTHVDVQNYLSEQNIGQAVTPITSGPMNADDAIKTNNNGEKVFYQNPDGGVPTERVEYDNQSWKVADDSMYVSIPLELSFQKEDTNGLSFLEKDVYISDLLIQGDWRNKQDLNNKKEDLSGSIRVHLSSYQSSDQSQNHSDTTLNRLISKDGGTILTEGFLDLDGDGDLDEYISGPSGANYHFGNEDDTNRHYTVYGKGTQTSYCNKYDIQNSSYQTLQDQTVNEKIYPSVVESIPETNILKEDSFEFVKEGETNPTSKRIGKTVAFDDMANEAYLNVVMTIWIEGWEPLPSPTNSDPNAKSPIWKPSDYIGSMFDVGITFAVQTEQ